LFHALVCCVLNTSFKFMSASFVSLINK
jgi:hypothetical protein